MSGFEIQKQEGILVSTKTQSLTARNGENGGNPTIDFKHIPASVIDKKDETKIKLMLMVIDPKINWDELSISAKQLYVMKLHDGTLEKECKKHEAEIASVKEKIKTMSPQAASEYITDLVLSRKYDNYSDLDEVQKKKILKKEAINLLDIIKPDLKIKDLEPKEQKKILANNRLTMQAMIFAYQKGKISDNPAEMEAIFKDKSAIADFQYEWAKEVIDNKPEILEEPNKKGNRALVLAYQKGTLSREIAEANGMKLEELRASDKSSQLALEYLTKKAESEELSDFEQKALEFLQKQNEAFGGDLTGVKNHHNGDVEESCMMEVFKNDENVNINDLNLDQIAKLREHITNEIKECKTPEEIQKQITHIMSHVNTDYERDLYEGIFAQMQKDGLLDTELYLQAVEESGLSTHSSVMHSKDVGAENQVIYAKHVAKKATSKHAEFTAKQAAGYTENIIPEYEKEAQAPSTNTMTDTGIQEVYDVLPKTYAKLDESAAKEAYEYAMTSDSISAEQKAIIARDTIDSFGNNNEMKEFFENIANKNSVDYNSVPPKSERGANENKPANETPNNIKIEGSKYSQTEFNNILAQTLDKSTGISAIIEAIVESGNTILGNTSEPKNASITKITTVDSAIDMLKSGTSFAKVFNRCSEDVKKSFIKGIMQSPQKDTAIKYLLEKGVQFATLLKCAPTENAKKSIYNIATDVHISTVKTEVKNFAAKV